jgi:peptidoglycan/xylan/chitin deacetylase (PgdA/CDA1 family)
VNESHNLRGRFGVMEFTTIVKAGLDAMHFSGAAALLDPVLRGMGCIFCLHEVRQPVALAKGFEPNHQLAIQPEFLDEVIKLTKQKGYALVSLAEIVERISKGKDTSPVAAFTLDDGYKNNATEAAPVFRANDCPYTIFIAPGFADGKTIMWWQALEAIVARSSQVRGMDTSSLEQKNEVFAKLVHSARSLDELEQRKWIEALAEEYGFDWRSDCRNAMMDWQEIRALALDPLCTFGAHTIEHYAVKRLPAETALYEMQASKQRIEKELGRKIDFFAYPYGDREHADARDFELAKQAGFTASVTTRKGVITKDHRDHLQSLPRIMVSGRYQKARHVKTLMSGLPLSVINGMKRTVTD